MQPAGHPDARLIEDAFLIVLGRAVGPIELRDQLRGFTAADLDGLVVRLLSSPEFRLFHTALARGDETGRDVQEQERALRALGPDDWFVNQAYGLLFRRPADPEGFAHYTRGLAEGEPRTSMLRWLMLSEEFDRRYREVAPEGGFVPRDMQLCELANPAKWSNPEWVDILRDLGLPDDPLAMHRKSYEFTQLVYGLKRLKRLQDDTTILSVGAGHEPVLYWLANHAGLVVATDMYEGIWQSIGAQEGDEQVIRTPAEYAPFPYRADRLTFLKMDGCALGFADGSFDVAYSLSSIEHFGGVAGARRAVAEMARTVKRGGIVAVATECIVAGPPHEETFQPADIRALFDVPDLRLVQPIDDRVYTRYDYVAVDLYRNPHQTPHMVVRWNDTVFTTVMVFLEKI